MGKNQALLLVILLGASLAGVGPVMGGGTAHAEGAHPSLAAAPGEGASSSLALSSFTVVIPGPAARIGLGYSATSVVPISSALPIYTPGDEVWAESYYGSPVLAGLIAPDGTVVTGFRYLYPNSTGALYTFSSHDTPGRWVVEVLGTSSPPVSIQLVRQQNLTTSVSGVSLLGHTASYSVSVGGDVTSDAEVCLLGAEVPTVVADLPARVASGALLIGLEGNHLQVGRNGSVFGSFTFSVELLQSRTYEIAGSNGTDTVEVEVGYTQPVVVSSATPPDQTAPVQISWLATPREGTLTLRIIITTAAGTQVTVAPVLYSAGGVVSLSACSPMATRSAGTFNLTANLDFPPSSWPRELVVTSSPNGVESAATYPIPWSVARVDVTTGGGKSFPASARIVAGPVPPGGSVSVLGSEVFFAGPTGDFPSSVGVNVSMLGVTSAVNATFEPFLVGRLAVPTGILNVTVTSGGREVANASLKVAGPDGNLSRLTGEGPVLVVLLPGTYAISAASGTQTSAASAKVEPGTVTSVALSLPSQNDETPLYLLIGFGLVGIVADLVVWFALPRRLLSVGRRE